MKRKQTRKVSLLLVLTMLGTMLYGSAVCAKEYPGNSLVPVEELQVGDVLESGCKFKIPDGYSVRVDNRTYTWDFFLNGNAIKITGIQKDEVNHVIEMRKKQGVYLSGVTEEGFERDIFFPGDTVKLSIPRVCDAGSFASWRIFDRSLNTGSGNYYLDQDIHTQLGLSEEDLKNPNLSFTIPDNYAEISGDKTFPHMLVFVNLKNGSTVSGNWIAVPDAPTVSGNEAPSGTTGGSSNTGEVQTVITTDVAAIRNPVASDGKAIQSASALSYYAFGVKGAAAVTAQAALNGSIGLTEEQLKQGTNAKFYVGDVYRTEVKTALREAASQINATVAGMLDIDLYTINRKGWIGKINDLTGETAEPVRMIFGLHDFQIQEGKSFSLVYMDKDGKVVEVPDLDNDPRTLTVDLTHFGPYAVVYK